MRSQFASSALVVWLLIQVGCVVSERQSVQEPAPATPLAADLKQCPFGHSTLKDVPILYGLVLPTPELEKKEQNLEVCGGGYSVGEEKRRFICATCRPPHTPLGPR